VHSWCSRIVQPAAPVAHSGHLTSPDIAVGQQFYIWHTCSGGHARGEAVFVFRESGDLPLCNFLLLMKMTCSSPALFKKQNAIKEVFIQ
jgi:hypothetical protein